MDVVTRIPPSPTGRMHIGTVRTALFNYLFAKHHGGKYLLRIEDTDKERSKKEYADAIHEDFSWLGLEPDSVSIQSEHVPRHAELLQELIEKGSAYFSKEPAKDDPSKELELVRLKNPGVEVTFFDLIRGDVTFDTSELGDFVIARSINDPVYHFAVVVDDNDAGVTHIIRGEDHISNTARQILIQEALGYERPQYAHIPLILASDKSKLSKRKHAVSIELYRQQGFLPEAILNYLALLGWNPGTEEELFSLSELVEHFTLDQVQKSGAVYDEVKLRWFNREYLQKVSDEVFLEGVKNFFSKEVLKTLEETGRLERLLPELRERIEVYSDVAEMAKAGEFSYFVGEPEYEKEGLFWKKDQSAENTKRRLEAVLEILEPLEDEKWTPESLKDALWRYAEEEGKGEVLWPLRYALSGREKSPDPFSLAAILGKDETVKRIRFAIDELLS